MVHRQLDNKIKAKERNKDTTFVFFPEQSLLLQREFIVLKCSEGYVEWKIKA